MIRPDTDTILSMHGRHISDGRSLRDVGREFGFSGEWVRQLFIDEGLPVRTRGEAQRVRHRERVRKAGEVQVKLLTERGEGLSWPEIARAHDGLTVKAIREALGDLP